MIHRCHGVAGKRSVDVWEEVAVTGRFPAERVVQGVGVQGDDHQLGVVGEDSVSGRSELRA